MTVTFVVHVFIYMYICHGFTLKPTDAKMKHSGDEDNSTDNLGNLETFQLKLE